MFFFSYYHESSAALTKYFKTVFLKNFLSSVMVIDPENRQKENLSKQRAMWTVLGKQLNHIISQDQLVDMLTTELSAFQLLEPADGGVEANEWWAQVAEVTLGGEFNFQSSVDLHLHCVQLCQVDQRLKEIFLICLTSFPIQKPMQRHKIY